MSRFDSFQRRHYQFSDRRIEGANPGNETGTQIASLVVQGENINDILGYGETCTPFAEADVDGIHEWFDFDRVPTTFPSELQLGSFRDYS